MTKAPYVCFKIGDRVEYKFLGEWKPAKVLQVSLDPNKKPGAGRVSYCLTIAPMYAPLWRAARYVRAVAL